MEGKAKAVSFLFPFLDAVNSDVQRLEFIKEIAKTLGISAHAIEMDYGKAKTGGFSRKKVPVGGDVPNIIHSARTADLVFLGAAILSEEPFRILASDLNIESIEDPRAKDLYIALSEAEKEGVRDVDGILSYCTNDAAVRFVRELNASGELSKNIDQIVEDRLAQKRKVSLEKERQKYVDQLRDAHETEQEKKILEEIMKIDVEIKATGGEINE
jgi:DNA primase